MGKFATFSERPKAKSVSHWGLRSQTPYYRGLTLVLGGLQLSNAGIDQAYNYNYGPTGMML